MKIERFLVASYVVTVVEDVVVACTCPGYEFRASCRHMSEAQGNLPVLRREAEEELTKAVEKAKAAASQGTDA